MALSLILVESALELVPNELASHPAILSWARRKRKGPEQLILDQTYHHAAILRLGHRGVGRGRPDIVHMSLLLALGSPLSMEGHLKCFVHTRDDKLITVNPKARLPRNTERFVALIEQLYREKVVPPTGPALLTLTPTRLPEILDKLGVDRVLALTTQGAPLPLPEVARSAMEYKKPAILIGGFAEGHYSRTTLQSSNAVYRIDKKRLEAWTVVARVTYDFETALKRVALDKTTLM